MKLTDGTIALRARERLNGRNDEALGVAASCWNIMHGLGGGAVVVVTGGAHGGYTREYFVNLT